MPVQHNHVRFLWLSVILLMLFALPLGIQAAEQPAPQPPLLASYQLPIQSLYPYDFLKHQPHGFVDGAFAKPGNKFHVTGAGAFTGWGMISSPPARSDTPEFTLTLNRSAQVAIAWISTATMPAWVQALPELGTVSIDNRTVSVHGKSYPAGEVTLATAQEYVILFGEVRSDIKAGEACPESLHDQYVTIGPDGDTYRTWHAQIDPVYWCHYGHEHGADARQLGIDYQPVYDLMGGGAAYPERSVVPSESHVGFKSYAMIAADGSRWYLTQHMGTADHHRVCGRFHTLEVYVADPQGERLAETYLSGDFGMSVSFDGADRPLTPDMCPTQADGVTGNGVRKIPGVFDGRFQGPYEPWRLSDTSFDPGLLGLDLNNITFATVNPVAHCDDLECDALIQTDKSGAHRFLDVVNGASVDAALLSHEPGEFFTNPYGTELRTGSEPDAVKQFIAPGAGAQHEHAKCKDMHGFGGSWTCGTAAEINALRGDAERENSIGPLN